MAYRNGSYLAPADFSVRFREEWDAAQVRFLKVERRQWYSQSGDESFDAFVDGQYERAERLLREIVLGQEEMYASAQARGVDLVRLRLVEEPLSDYLRFYEIPSYSVSEDLGERILLASVDSSQDELPDCIIFDSAVMFVNAYDGVGRLIGAVEVRAKDQIEHHANLAEGLLAGGQPLAEFVRAHAL